ncbi:MAG: GumC family protein [Ahrensia sp.]|nr:GumC family protein [Ahrensia sp.]
MLNRILSKKDDSAAESDDSQGSLLDRIAAQGPVDANVFAFPNGQQQSGSLLSAFGEEQSRSNMHAAYQPADYAASAHHPSQATSRPPSPEPDVTASRITAPVSDDAAWQTGARRDDQQQQLDMLRDELQAIAQAARTDQSQPPEPAALDQQQADLDQPNGTMGRSWKIRRKKSKPRVSAKSGQPSKSENTKHMHQPADAVAQSTVATTSAGTANHSPRLNLAGAFSFERFVLVLLRGWYWILACGLIGAIIAALYALSLPNKYLSVSEVLIEPRGIRVIDNSVSPNGLNSEATVAYAESQVRILTSSSVLDPVIEDLDLVNDTEFNGTDPSTGLLGGLLKVVMGERDDPGTRFTNAKEYLVENMYVARINQTFTIQIGVSTEDPQKSARIANAIARGYMNAETRARSSAARNATEDLTGRLDELRVQVRDSEEKVEAYKAENGLVDADGKLVSEVQLSRLNDQLAVAQAQVSDARSRAQLAAQADLSDVLSGSLPTALASPTVSQLRVQFSRAKAQLDRLSTTLGPRHPERIGAEAELRSARQAIAAELSRIVDSAQEDFQSARSRLADIQGQVNALKASAVTDSAAKVRLRELEREVVANRQVYEAFLLRSRETGEQENIRTESARIISEATPPVEKDGPNRKLIVVVGGIVGGILGVILALLPLAFGIVRDLVRSGLSAPQSGHQGDAPVQPRNQTSAYAVASRNDDLYSSHNGYGTDLSPHPAEQQPYPTVTQQPAPQPAPIQAACQPEPAPVQRPTVAKRPSVERYEEAPSRKSNSGKRKRKAKRSKAARGAGEALREELAALRHEMLRRSEAQSAAQPQPQPAPSYAAPPQPAYAPPIYQQPVYQPVPAPMPVIQPMAYAAPMMPQPMAYPTWPQQAAPVHPQKTGSG